jgi:hypothetical protein
VQTSGPGGGYVVCLATHDSDVFAGTVQGFYSMKRNGPGWNTITSVLSSQFVCALAIKDTTIFAGTYGGGGAYRSVDKGVTWTPANTGMNSLNVFCFAVHDSVLFAGSDSGVFWTADNGAHWAEVTTKASCRYANALATWGNHLYVGTSICAVLTGDTANGWSITSSMFLASSLVTSFARIGQNLFAGTCHGVFLSIDSGVGWTPAWTGVPIDTVSALAVVGTCLFAGTNHGGVFRTMDNGTTWTSVNEGLPDTNVFTLASSREFLFAGTVGAGVWWRPLSEIVPSTKENTKPAEQNVFEIQAEKNTGLRYRLPGTTAMAIKLFDLHGRLIRVLLNATQAAGAYTAAIPSDVPAGRYVVSVRAGALMVDKAFMVVR